MPTVEGLESWRGQDVLDSAGEKVGRLQEVYYDAAGQEPVLISIKHGRLGHQVKLAPLSDAAVSRDYVRLPFSGEQARRRADELELTATDRQQEAEEARRRAGAATEEARAAQRAREQAEEAAADPAGGTPGSP